MTNEQFVELLSELMEKVGNNPDSHTNILSQIAKRHAAFQELQSAIVELNESLGAIRLIFKYLLFDLEATRRERNQLRTMLEDQD